MGQWLARKDPRVFDMALRADAEQGVERIVADTGIPVAAEHRHFPQGAARTVIADFAAKAGIEALVLGSVGRSGLPGLVIGETAEAILQRVACAVLVVKPDGFVSPVLAERAA